MSDLLIQVLGLVALIGGTVMGYRRWVNPRPNLGLQAKGLLLLLTLTFVGALFGSVGWWFADARSFSWLLPPLASRMLASAAWAFAVVVFMALEHPTVHRLRLAILMLVTYFVPLVIAIVLFHLDRFDFTAPITYAFFIISIGMTISALWYLFRQPVILPELSPQDSISTSPMSWLWLLIVAVVTAVWGLALFFTDSGSLDWLWVWPGDLLTSRLIAVMLLTLAVASWYARPDWDTTRIMLFTISVYAAGMTAASLWNAISNQPVKGSYALVFGLMALVSIVILAFNRQPVVLSDGASGS